MSAPAEFASLDDAFVWIINSILKRGEDIAPRGIPTSEVRALSISIANPRRRYISLPPRRWSFGYALGEFCWHARGSSNVEEISFYSRRWREMSDDGRSIRGSCYGAQIFQARDRGESQWHLVRRVLDADPASRRATFAFSDGMNADLLRSRDINCATTLQFYVRANKLEAIATMRSNDVILGLPYDIFLFTMLQEMMAVELGLELGSYHHFVGSMHVYKSNLEWAESIISATPTINEPMPKMTSVDDIHELLENEPQTRRRDSLAQRTHSTASYWGGLLRVLQSYNGARLGNATGLDLALEPALYRQLMDLRPATRS